MVLPINHCKYYIKMKKILYCTYVHDKTGVIAEVNKHAVAPIPAMYTLIHIIISAFLSTVYSAVY